MCDRQQRRRGTNVETSTRLMPFQANVSLVDAEAAGICLAVRQIQSRRDLATAHQSKVDDLI